MTVSHYRHRRTSTAATPFPTPVEPGEIVVNTANRQLAVGDAASATLGQPVPLLAVRIFDPRAQYATGDFVVNAGTLYRANTPISPNPFNPAQWDTISSADVSKAYVDAGDAAVTAAFQSADTAINSSLAGYLPKAGGTMSGALTLAADPATNLQASTKQYVDGKVASIPTPSSLTVSDTPPTGVPDGALWWESDSGLLYVKYNDGNTTQWVIACPQPDISSYALKTDVAPAIAASAVRYDAGQSLTAPQQQQGRQNIFAAPFDALAYNGLQINGAMEISQEKGTTATSLSNALAYIVDGWVAESRGVATIDAVQNTAAIPGGFAVSAHLFPTVGNSSPAAADYNVLYQRLEGLPFRNLQWGAASAGPITLSFWVATGRPGLNSGVIRNGASNSRAYAFTYTTSVANTWEYKTITVPGDVAGTWVKDATEGVRVIFCMMAGSGGLIAPNVWTASTTAVGAIGQTNNCQTGGDQLLITGVTIFAGSAGPSALQSPYAMRPYDQELVRCQRYYQKFGDPAFNTPIGSGHAATTLLCKVVVPLRTQMRAPPQIIAVPTAAGIVATSSLGAGATTAVGISANMSAVGGVQLDITTSGSYSAGTSVIGSITAGYSLSFDMRL